MAAGVALGVFAPNVAKQLGLMSTVFSAPDPFHHRASAVRHTRGRNRRRRRSQTHGANRRQGHPLFRNRHYLCAVPWVGRGQPGASRRWRPDLAHGCRLGGACHTHDARCSSGTHVPGEHHRRHGPQRRAASRGLRLPVRRRLCGDRRQGRSGGHLLHCARRSNVPLHEVRDVPGAARRRGRSGRHRGKQGHRGPVRAGQADYHYVRDPGAVRGAGAGCGDRDRTDSSRRFLPGGARALPDRVLHGQQRSRAAAGVGKHGAVRRAQAHCGLRDSYRLQFQSGWHHALSLHGLDVRSAGRRCPHDAWASSWS